jgi:hypothetical protein
MHGPVGRPVSYFGSADAWQVEVAGQGLSHMSTHEPLRFSAAFGGYAILKDALLQEQDAWLRLGMLDRPDVLQEGDWPVLHQAFAEASSLNLRLREITDNVLTNHALGQQPRDIKPPPGIRAALKTLCSPIRK